jgi:hypothetical protein
MELFHIRWSYFHLRPRFCQFIVRHYISFLTRVYSRWSYINFYPVLLGFGRSQDRYLVPEEPVTMVSEIGILGSPLINVLQCK